MKRTIIIAAVLIMAIAALTGCNTGSDSKADTGTPDLPEYNMAAWHETENNQCNFVLHVVIDDGPNESISNGYVLFWQLPNGVYLIEVTYGGTACGTTPQIKLYEIEVGNNTEIEIYNGQVYAWEN